MFLLVLLSFLTAAQAMPPNYQISAASPEVQNEECVAVCPTDSTVLVAIWRDFRLGYRRIGIGRSTDAGQTWTDSLINLGIHPQQTDPVLSTDRLGNFYICIMDMGYDTATTVNYSSLTYLKSTDRGSTWVRTYTFDDPSHKFLEDKPWADIDRTGGTYDGNFYVAWTRAGRLSPQPGRVICHRSTDGMTTFGDTLVLAPPNDPGSCYATTFELDAGQFTAPLVGADGVLHSFWVSSDFDTIACALVSAYLMVRRSFDGGVTFDAPRRLLRVYGSWGVVDGIVNVMTIPSVAADLSAGPFGGYLYVATASVDTNNTTAYDYNIEFLRSTDGGTTWSNPYPVNDDFTGPGALFDQFHVQIRCNEEGTLAAIFYDQRTDSVNHYKFDVFAAYSFDGGQSFTTNHRISDVSIDPDLLGVTPPFAGVAVGARNPMSGTIAEYIGLTMFRDHVNAVWTDTRNGNQDVYGANWVIPMLRPRLLDPANGDTVYEFSGMRWAAAWKSDDDRYRLEFSDDSTFASTLLVETTDTTLRAYTDTLAQGGYYWRVKAFAIGSGDSTEYSDTYSFYMSRCFDSDGDGFGDPGHPLNLCAEDNCPALYNPGQDNFDGDPWGDVCDNCLRYFTPDNVAVATGDVNVNGSITSADIIVLVAYVFKGGVAPQPIAEAGDVNCDHSVTSADIIYLVNHVFKGGPGPCDACAVS